MMNLFLSYIILVLVICTGALSASADAPATTQPGSDTQAYLFQLSYEEAEKALGDALVEKGAGTQVAAAINGTKDGPMFSYSHPVTVEIRDLTFDKPAAKFSANLLAVADDKVITARPVSGRFEETVDVPVLKRQLRNGETISESDIEMRNFPLARTRADTVMDSAKIVGKSPERTISAFRPIREHEIENLPVVKKNGIVQMRYVTPGMEITTAGQAMEDGAKGSVISVKNLSSKRVIQAVVEGESLVSVTPTSSSAAAPAPAIIESSQLTGETSHVAN